MARCCAATAAACAARTSPTGESAPSREHAHQPGTACSNLHLLFKWGLAPGWLRHSCASPAVQGEHGGKSGPAAAFCGRGGYHSGWRQRVRLAAPAGHVCSGRARQLQVQIARLGLAGGWGAIKRPRWHLPHPRAPAKPPCTQLMQLPACPCAAARSSIQTPASLPNCVRPPQVSSSGQQRAHACGQHLSCVCERQSWLMEPPIPCRARPQWSPRAPAASPTAAQQISHSRLATAAQVGTMAGSHWV